jgi:serine/threonine-protein kinase
LGVHGTGRLSDGRPCMLMDLVRGESVAERLSRGPLPVQEALAIAQQVLSGLSALSAAGVVHRDVKPSNVMLEQRPDGVRAVLVDYGAATLLADPEFGGKRRGVSLIGTPEYMAPEQFDGRPVDARTDVYGAAALLYEMLTGRAPRCERGAQGWRSEPTPPCAVRNDVPRHVSRAVMRALAVEPRARFAGPAAFRHSLAARRPLVVLRPLLAVPALAAAAYLLAPWLLPQTAPATASASSVEVEPLVLAPAALSSRPSPLLTDCDVPLAGGPIDVPHVGAALPREPCALPEPAATP